MDELTFYFRGWLNWLVIQAAIIKIHLRRWPATWAIDVLATALVTLLLVPAWAIYRLVFLLGKVG